VIPVSTSAFPTAARRPANSRHDNSRLADIHGVRLPDWKQSLQACVERVIARDFGR
jgi:dTDP-4-dehydrorhamnose reductase